MRRGVYNRDIYPRFKRRVITEDDVRSLCEKVKARNAPATALHVRDVIKAVFEFAALKRAKIPNPAASIAPKAIATIKARDVIAHRLSTVSAMDRILVFEHGHIVEEGNHEALLRRPQGHYRRLFERQSGAMVDVTPAYVANAGN